LWKLSDEGTTLWVERAGGTGYDQLNGVALSGAMGRAVQVDPKLTQS